MEISDKIKNLSPEQREYFNKYLMDCFNDRTWCAINKIKHYETLSREDRKKAREVAYLELFDKKAAIEYYNNS